MSFLPNLRKLFQPRPHRQATIRQFGYDATTNKKRRKAASATLKSEDRILDTTDRRKLIHAGRELRRNFSVARWMINKHLDWVANVSFQSRNGIEELDKRVEELVAWWARPKNFDVAGRHGLYRSIRLAEASRTVDGDMAYLLVSDGRTQAIEGDRIRKPTTGIPHSYRDIKWTHGVKLTKAGRASAYCICQRGSHNDSFTFQKVLPAKYCVLHAYWDRFDQVRGISPIAGAINSLRDAYEGSTYALLKMKVSQMFGLATFRADDAPTGKVSGGGDTDTEEPFEVDFDKPPFHLDLDQDDKAEFIESRSPPQEFQAFWQTALAAALKSLDIPWSFYDESFTNFFGSRAAVLNYQLAAQPKRADVRETLDRLLRWRIQLWLLDGELQLPEGLELTDLKWEWVPAGVPWWNPIQEVKADILAIGAGLQTRSAILRAQGKDFKEVADRIAEENDYLRFLGLPVGPAVAAEEPPSVPQE